MEDTCERSPQLGLSIYDEIPLRGPPRFLAFLRTRNALKHTGVILRKDSEKLKYWSTFVPPVQPALGFGQNGTTHQPIDRFHPFGRRISLEPAP
jgi:hypothetical protein